LWKEIEELQQGLIFIFLTLGFVLLLPHFNKIFFLPFSMVLLQKGDNNKLLPSFFFLSFLVLLM
jgi:hypothetical protein